MKFMKKSIYLAAMLCGLAGIFSSCSDDEEEVKAGGDDIQYKPVVYLGDSDVKEVSIQDFDKDVVFTTSVCQKGNGSSSALDATLTVMTEDEMYYYNKVYGRSYTIMPSTCYEFQKDYAFSSGEEAHKVEITLKKEILYLDSSKKYALPLSLTSKNGEIDEINGILIIAVNTNVPEIGLGMSGKQEPIDFQFVETEQTIEIPVLLNSDNLGWGFTAEFETEPEVLKTLVAQYPSDGTEYSLLSADHYEMEPAVVFSAESYDREKNLSVKIKKGELEPGNYLLPIVLKGCTGMPFTFSTEICFIHIRLKDWEKIDIKGKLTSNGETTESDWVLAKLTDGSPDTGWQSPWYVSYWPTGQNTCDPTYGIYVDINQVVTKGMFLKVYTSATNNYPKKWRVYAKPESSSEWELLKEYNESFVNTPTSFTTEKFLGSYSAIRVAFIINKGGTDLRTLQSYSQWYYANVGISELELFGI